MMRLRSMSGPSGAGAKTAGAAERALRGTGLPLPTGGPSARRCQRAALPVVAGAGSGRSGGLPSAQCHVREYSSTWGEGRAGLRMVNAAMTPPPAAAKPEMSMAVRNPVANAVAPSARWRRSGPTATATRRRR